MRMGRAIFLCSTVTLQIAHPLVTGLAVVQAGYGMVLFTD